MLPPLRLAAGEAGVGALAPSLAIDAGWGGGKNRPKQMDKWTV